MSVVGFQEAYENALTVNLKGSELKVASLPGIVMLKLMAWDERGAENSKDATDFYSILSRYGQIHDGRLWEDADFAVALTLFRWREDFERDAPR